VPVGELCAIAAAFVWAVGMILFSRIGRDVTPGAMNLGKCITGALLLSITHVLLSSAVIPPKATGNAGILLAASGIAGLTIGDTALFGAIVTLGVPRAILLHSSAPVFAAIGGFAFMGERISPRALVGMALALSGIILVILRRGTGEPAGKHVPRGIVLGIIGALGQAAGSLLSRSAMQGGIDPLAASAGRLVVGGVGLVLLASLAGKARGWAKELARDRAWAKVAGTALLGTYCGIWLAQTALLRAKSTGVATTLLATSPVFALPMAHFAKMERISARAMFGVGLAIFGIALISTSR